jgi:tetratricopeptide (TPR) repeat protein
LLVEADQAAVSLAEFQSAIDYDPKNSLAIHNRAVTLAQQNNYDAALADFNRVIELNPGLAVAYRNRAELLAAQGNADDAIADYTRAIEAMPDDAELYRARAHALQQLDEYERALSDLDRSIQIAPNVAQGYSQRGNLLADRADFSRALDDFKQALTLDPKLADAHCGLAWIKATCPDDRLRDAFEALASAHTAVKLSAPDDYLTLDVLAAAHANAGEFDKAIAVEEQAINAAPADAVPSMRARLNLYEHRRPYRVGR